MIALLCCVRGREEEPVERGTGRLTTSSFCEGFNGEREEENYQGARPRRKFDIARRACSIALAFIAPAPYHVASLVRRVALSILAHLRPASPNISRHQSLPVNLESSCLGAWVIPQGRCLWSMRTWLPESGIPKPPPQGTPALGGEYDLEYSLWLVAPAQFYHLPRAQCRVVSLVLA